MHCQEVELELLKGKAMAPQAQAHLDACKSCQTYWSELAILSDLLAQPAPELAPAIDVSRKVMARLPQPRSWPPLAPRWAVGLAAAAVVVFAGIALRSLQAPGTERMASAPKSTLREAPGTAERTPPLAPEKQPAIRPKPIEASSKDGPMASVRISDKLDKASGLTDRVVVREDKGGVSEPADILTLAMAMEQPTIRLKPATAPETEIEAASALFGP